MRRAPRRDVGEKPIVEALRRAGAVVRQLDGAGLPDLLVGWRGSWSLLECKSPIGPRGGKSRDGQKLKPKQQLFRVAAQVVAGCEVHIVRSPAEALAAVGVTLVEGGGG